MGGGSAIDTGKALAAMLANPGDPLDYLEVIGRGQPLGHASAPFIAIPTTAGTGSEVTRTPCWLRPSIASKPVCAAVPCCPGWRWSTPNWRSACRAPVTASTGLDALTQVIEPYVGLRANAMTDLFCVEGIRCAAGALPRVWEDGGDRHARTDMAWASLLGGLALANAASARARLCGAGWRHVPRSRTARLRGAAAARDGSQHSGPARACAGQPGAAAVRRSGAPAHRPPASPPPKMASAGRDICRKLEIPPLRAYGVSEADIPDR